MTSTSVLHNRKQASINPTETERPKLSNSALHRLTLSWHEIPEWMKDNEYIVSGYRREQNSVVGCTRSIFGYLHNETVNIHSHLWGAVLFVSFLFTLSARLDIYPTAGLYDTVGFAIFLIAAILCLSLSAIYHMMTCHSQEMADRCHPFDYAGIVVLTVGSFFPCIYYGFYCEPHLKVIYLTIISLAGCGAAYIVLSPTYSRPSHRGARTSVFLALGLCAVVPVTHALYSHGYRKICQDLGFNWLLTSGALYVTGALIYANRLPERWWPGKFDYFLASHQIFHAHVVLAALSHYMCISTAAHHWHGVLGGVCLVS